MAKQRHNASPPDSTPPKGPIAILAVGAILVAALVGWALTRTVETTPVTDTNAGFTATSSPTPTTDTSTLTASTSTPAPAPIEMPVTSTMPPEHAQTPEKAEVQRISAEDLREKVKAGSVVVIDVRDATAYAAAHIPGALNIPMASVEANLDRLPKDKEIVAYCT
jgi:Rhodanese-like domain